MYSKTTYHRPYFLSCSTTKSVTSSLESFEPMKSVCENDLRRTLRARALGITNAIVSTSF